MPITKVKREEVISRLLAVFGVHGYEGASMAMIAEKVGLQKASLYHLFPGGKEEMANAVLTSIGEFMEEHVLRPLRAGGSPQERLADMIEKVRTFYQGGKASCLFETMSLGAGDGPFRATIKGAMSAWIEAMARLAKEGGASAAVARERAERVVTTIQGSLVVARCMNDPNAFVRGLKTLPEILLPGS